MSEHTLVSDLLSLFPLSTLHFHARDGKDKEEVKAMMLSAAIFALLRPDAPDSLITNIPAVKSDQI